MADRPLLCSQAQHGADLLHHVPAIMRDAQFEQPACLLSPLPIRGGHASRNRFPDSRQHEPEVRGHSRTIHEKDVLRL